MAYLLGATDLHYENVIAVGEYPVIVDLETLFHVTLASGSARGATAVALSLLGNSVSRTLLLPTRIYGDDLGDASPRSADISALGYAAGQEAPFMGQDWDASGTDAMHLVEKRGSMPSADCLPELDGTRIPATKYVDDIVRGFGDAYDLLLRHRKTLRNLPGGPLNVFRGRMMRQVFRPTAHYVQLLSRSWHPRYARDAKVLESDLRRRLSALDAGLSSQRAFLNAEVTDLMNGDVPYFRAKIGGRIAISPLRPRSRIHLPSYGWRACQQRIASLGPLDKERQIWLIRMSFVDLNAPVARTVVVPNAGNRRRINAAARRIGDRLCELAITRAGRASWPFPMASAEYRLVPATTGFDLYDGLEGIALFLGCLSCETGVARYREMAVAAIREALSLYRSVPEGAVRIGGFDGAGFLAYVSALLSRSLARADWARQSAEIVRDQVRHAARYPGLDLIFGRAGFLAAGVGVAQIIGDPSLLKFLCPCAQSLRAIPARSLPRDADAGMAHGKAGIGFALARWAEVTAQPAWLRSARSLIEADLMVAQKARDEVAESNRAEEGTSMIGWCRGGLGAALAALRLHVPVAQMAQHLVRDAKAELAKGTNAQALGLCHGLLGTLEFLETARAAGISGVETVYDRVKGEALGRVLGGEVCCDHSHRLEAPGLMKGLAGTGYALLRILNPRDVLSILTFEPGPK